MDKRQRIINTYTTNKIENKQKTIIIIIIIIAIINKKLTAETETVIGNSL
jgi:hypothetical protein